MAKKLHLLLVVLLLATAFFVRIYRTDDLLRFYYDQGRDALVIREMITTPKPVLVGPTTGLAGILRGPAFYYILLPAYLVGQGDPVVAAIWLQVINTVGLFIFYLLARSLFSPLAGLFALLFLGFSNHMVDLSRWLSNPSPILTAVPLMLFGLYQIKNKRRPEVWWPVVAFIAGINLQLEMASEFWFLPILAYLALFHKDYRAPIKTIVISAAAFFATLLPQIFFDLRHSGIMRQAIIANFSSQSTSSFGFDQKNILERLDYYRQVFTGIISPNQSWFISLLLLLAAPLALFSKARRAFFIPFLFFTFPLLVLLFYQGNSGNFYSYYLIGTFPIFLLLISGLLHFYSKSRALLFIPLIVIAVFLATNLPILRNFLISGTDGPFSISYENQLQNIDWIYQKAAGRPFNVDVYVPPVIPYSYDYLFAWHGQKTYGYQPAKEPQEIEFTLYEVDPNSARFPDWHTTNTADHPVLIDQFASGGVHSEYRTK